MGEPMDATGIPGKRTLSDSEVDSSSRKAARSEADKKLTALVENFFNERFETDCPITAKTREVMIRFGVELNKHLIDEIQNVNSMVQLRLLVVDGFDTITKRLEKLENSKSEDKPKLAESSARSTYSDMLKKRSEVLPASAEVPPPAAIEDDNKAKNFTVLEFQEKVDDRSFTVFRSKLTKQLLKKQARVEKIVRTSTGNVAIQYDSIDQQQKVESILRDEPIDAARVRSSKNKSVSIALKGISKEWNVEDVKRKLANENRDHQFFRQAQSWDLRLIDPIDGRSRYKMGKITTSLQSARILMNNPKIYLDSMAVNAELWKPNHRRCHNCFKPNHVAAKCSDSVKCPSCGGDHAAAQCAKKNAPKCEAKCIVCLRENKAANHRASIKECPILMDEQMEEFRKIFHFMNAK